MLRLKPDEDLVMVQSGDPVNYFDMLRATSRPNRAYCIRHGIHYECLSVVMRGYHPWHACFNRIYVLNDLLDLGWEGWFLHLDADAYVADAAFDVRAYLRALPDRAFVFVPGGDPAWMVNNGVFFANLGHPVAREVIRDWRALLERQVTPEALRAAPGWGEVMDDQHALQVVLRDRHGAMDAVLIETPRFINGATARFVRQILRARERDPTRRLRRVVAEAEAAARRGGAGPEPMGVILGGVARGLGLPAPPGEAAEEAERGPDAFAAVLRAMLDEAGR